MTTEQTLQAIYQFLPLLGIMLAACVILALYAAIDRLRDLEDKTMDVLADLRTHLIAKAPQAISASEYYGLEPHRDAQGRFTRRTGRLPAESPAL